MNMNTNDLIFLNVNKESDKIESLDELVFTHLEKYKFGFLFLCFCKKNNLPIEFVNLLKKYTKYLLLGEKYIPNISLFTSTKYIHDDYCTILKKNNLISCFDEVCLKFTNNLIFTKGDFLLFIDDLLDTNNILFYSEIILHVQTKKLNQFEKLELYEYLFSFKTEIINKLILENHNNIWFSEIAEKTILGNLFNHPINEYKQFNIVTYNFIIKLSTQFKFILKWLIDYFNYYQNKKITNYDSFSNITLFLHKFVYNVLQNNETFEFHCDNVVVDLGQDYSNKYIINGLFNLSISYLELSVNGLIQKIKDAHSLQLSLKKLIEEYNNSIDFEGENSSFIQKTFLAMQKKALNNVNMKIEKYIKNLSYYYEVNVYLPQIVNLIIKVLLKNESKKEVQNLIEILTTLLNNNLFILYFKRKINILNLIKLINKLNNNLQINLHIKSKLTTTIYNYRELIYQHYCLITTIQKDEDNLTLVKFIEGSYQNYLTFHKSKSTWLFYEKMYNKIDILSFLIYIYDKKLPKKFFVNNNSNTINHIVQKIIYIVLEDIIELNKKLFQSCEKIEKESQTKIEKNKIKMAIEKNKINFNLIEINLEFINVILTTCFSNLFQEEIIMKQVILTIHYLLEKNIIFKFKDFFPIIFDNIEFKLELNKYRTIYNLLIDIMSNKIFIKNDNYLQITKKNKYFKESNLNLINYECDNFRFFIFKLTTLKQTETVEDEIKYPSEFYDPIMFSLIKDPVYLPDSDLVVDRTVITQYLVTNDIDPFTRSKLTQDILEKHNQKKEIQEKIKLFLNKKESIKKKLTI